MAAPSHSDIVTDGLWSSNVGLVQLLGLCPLLAISNTVVNAVGLGLATTLTLMVSNVSVSLSRRFVRSEIRIPVFVLIIAAVVTAIEMLMNAYWHSLYLVLGIYIPLIVTNCAILARAESFASRHDVGRSALDGLAVGLGFTGVLVALGALREIVGQGTLFTQFHLLLGEIARGWELTLIPDYPGFLLAVLPPGAFFGLGALVALKNWIEDRRGRPAPARDRAPAPEAVS